MSGAFKVSNLTLRVSGESLRAKVFWSSRCHDLRIGPLDTKDGIRLEYNPRPVAG
jgi:hypothetical protein